MDNVVDRFQVYFKADNEVSIAVTGYSKYMTDGTLAMASFTLIPLDVMGHSYVLIGGRSANSPAC